ncbi:L-arabinose 1-dehydrogenase [Roseibium alexandrii]|uniref:L-arabinose 1-dehydrogenase n=2 Tax=Roseibium alexandrii TaxID=388408 RepID=A0A0M7AIC2_9HYPH|nr:L-arabinose 1-dehydrogenase [Roseibium alexandrii]
MPFEYWLFWLSNSEHSHDLLDCVSDADDGNLVVFVRLAAARLFGVYWCWQNNQEEAPETPTMSNELGIGILGCGKTSRIYFNLIPKFNGLQLRACADLNREVALVRADEFDIRAETVHDLFQAEDISVIVNLSAPDAHAMMSREILNNGKHVYSEKPFARTSAEGAAVRQHAEKLGLFVGCAPDTFMGGAPQTARKAISEGLIGEVNGATLHAMNHGMEAWHPNPDLFYKSGIGPMADFGPYFICSVLNLLGPVEQVSAMSSTPVKTRTIGQGPRKGEVFDVETPTTIHATLSVMDGPLVAFSASWDVHAHAHSAMEIYGSEGTLFLPDPVFFGGDVIRVLKDGTREVLNQENHPFGLPNFKIHGRERANYRSAGLADMANAVRLGHDFRCSMERALHTVDVIEAIQTAAATGQHVKISEMPTRPAPLSPDQAKALLR